MRAGFALSTVDERLPVAPSEEYGSITGRIDTPSGDFRPRFQLSQGPLASLLLFPVVRADGTIPFAGTNYSGRNATWVDPTRKSPYAMNWNFGVQHTFATNYLVELTYTGNSSVNGFENREINSISYDWANNLRLTNPTAVQRLPEQHADLPAVSELRQHHLPDQRRPLQLPCRHDQTRQALLARPLVPDASTPTRRGSIPAAATICSPATWTARKAATTAPTSTPAA